MVTNVPPVLPHNSPGGLRGATESAQRYASPFNIARRVDKLRVVARPVPEFPSGDQLEVIEEAVGTLGRSVVVQDVATSREGRAVGAEDSRL